MALNIDNPALTALRAKCASLESRLKEETSAHALARELLQDRLARAENNDSNKSGADAEFSRAHEMLAGFMDAATDGFAILDRNLRFLDINRQGAENIALPKSEIVGRPYREVIPASERTNPGILDAFEDVLRTGRAARFEGSIRKAATDRVQWLNGQAFPIGEDQIGLIVSIDTERVEAEQALKESERRLLESQRIGTFENDLVTGEVVWTDEAFRLLGYEPGEAEASFDTYLERVHPDDYDNALQAQAAVQWDEAPPDSVRRVVWPDGSVHVLAHVAELERNPTGKPIRLTRTAQDVTQRVQAEEALRDSQETLRLFTESATDWFVTLDGDLNYLDANRAMVEAYGISREELLRKNLTVLAPQSKTSGRYDKCLEVIQTGKPWHFELEEVSPLDGRVRFLFVAAFKVGDGLGIAAQDITERKLAEISIRESRNDLAAAQRIAHVGSWRRDSDTDELVWSDEHWAIFGLEPGEVSWIDPAFFDSFVHPDDLEAVQNDKQRAMEAGSSFDSAFRIVRRDGEVRSVHSRSESGGTDDRRHFVGTIQDVTDRVQAEDALRSSQSMFERAFESSPGLAFIVSFADRRLVKVNDAWCKRLGYKREEVIGRTTDELGFWNDDEARKKLARDEIARTGAVRDFRTTLRSALGDTIHVETSADSLEYDGGRAIFTVAHDRTERKRFEDAIWEAKENAELANRTKSEFLANVSHELRTPLNAILGFSEMMGSGLVGPLTGKQTEYLSDIRASGEHLLGLIGDVIDLSTIELGKMKLVVEQVDLHKCVEECVTQVRNRIAELGLTLRIGDFMDLPLISGDKRRIKQVIINLLSNASKFTEPGGKITVAGVETDQNECAVTVTDTGVGMNKEMIRQALTAFKRGDDPMLRNMEGAGLGLSLVQSMVESHGGSVAIESALGEGTKVTVTFPIDGPTVLRATLMAG